MRARPRLAFWTLMVLPASSVALRPAMAASASSADSIVTNANPRESRVWGSRITWHFWIRPNLAKASSKSRSSTRVDRPETCRLLPGLPSTGAGPLTSRKGEACQGVRAGVTREGVGLPSAVVPAVVGLHPDGRAGARVALAAGGAVAVLGEVGRVFC